MTWLTMIPSSKAKIQVKNTARHSYKLSSVLGKGRTAIVYKGDKLDAAPRQVAIKHFTRPITEDVWDYETEKDSFDELSRYHDQHNGQYPEHVLKLIDVGAETDKDAQHPASRFLVFELGGMTLAEYIESPNFDIRESAVIFLQALKGIHALHEAGIAHSDLHRGNLLFVKDENDKWVVKVCDLGFSITERMKWAKESYAQAMLNDMYSLAVLLISCINQGRQNFFSRGPEDTLFLSFLETFRPDSPDWDSEAFFEDLERVEKKTGGWSTDIWAPFFYAMMAEKSFHPLLRVLKGLVDVPEERLTSDLALTMMEEIIKTTTLPRTFNTVPSPRQKSVSSLLKSYSPAPGKRLLQRLSRFSPPFQRKLFVGTS